MGAPQIIMIVIMALCFAIHCIKHGEEKNDKYHCGIELLSTAIMVGLLIWGGFFK